MDNPTTLKNLVPFLQDKRFTKSGTTVTVEPQFLLAPPGQDPDEYRRTHPMAPVSGPHTDYFRVCDIALTSLAQKTGIDIGIPDVVSRVRQHPPYILPRYYTDAELNEAYIRLKCLLPANRVKTTTGDIADL